MKPTLRVYVAEHCPNCEEACSIATQIEQTYSEVDVEIIDIGQTKAVVPEKVFAIPTFMLDDRIISLGNPYLWEIARIVEDAIARLI
jgi:hypothetical protein